MKRIILLAVALMVASSNDKICETKLDKMQGCVIKEYQGKVLVKETPYKNNKINGIAKEYYPSTGKLKFMDTVEDDISNGEQKEFYENGQLLYSIFYKNGKLIDGISKTFYANGKIRSEINTIDGFFDGETKVYKENGKLILKLDFKDGRPLGGKCANNNVAVPAAAWEMHPDVFRIARLCEQNFLF